jgi:hypothetical protein
MTELGSEIDANILMFSFYYGIRVRSARNEHYVCPSVGTQVKYSSLRGSTVARIGPI